jgi:hypothetical protein
LGKFASFLRRQGRPVNLDGAVIVRCHGGELSGNVNRWLCQTVPFAGRFTGPRADVSAFAARR